MNARFQTQWKPAVFEGEFNSLPSETRPSKTLSLREIIQRDLNLQILPASAVEPYYNEDILLPDFKRMDPVDIDNWKADMEIKHQELIKRVTSERKERAAQLKKQKDAKEKQFAERLEAARKGSEKAVEKQPTSSASA